MTITIIDQKKQKSIVCSFAKAASIIGVSAKTVSRWYKSKADQDIKVEEYNNFTIYFDTEYIKQSPRNKQMSY